MSYPKINFLQLKQIFPSQNKVPASPRGLETQSCVFALCGHEALFVFEQKIFIRRMFVSVLWVYENISALQNGIQVFLFPQETVLAGCYYKTTFLLFKIVAEFIPEDCHRLPSTNPCPEVS